MKNYVIEITRVNGDEIETMEKAEDFESAAKQVVLYAGDKITSIREIPNEDIVDLDEEE